MNIYNKIEIFMQNKVFIHRSYKQCGKLYQQGVEKVVKK